METEKKKPKGYAQIGISHETYDKLTRVKERKSKEVGIELSWNEFFRLFLKDGEEVRR